MAIGKVNTGGGGSGGTLTVTGIAGHTVTATKGGKTYTRTFNSSGVAVFKGLSTGTWTLTMTGDGQTATRTVDVNADYSVTITYFSATINITYPAKSTCVVKNSGGTTVASDTNTGSSTKTWTATVGATGTYTVTATATDGSGKTKSTTVSITADGQSESVTLSYELYIFKSGTGMTSGYSASFAPYLSGGSTSNSINKTAITWATNAAQGGNMVISPAADLSSYNTLHVELDYTDHYDGGYVTFGVGDSTQGSSFTASKEDTYNTSKHTITIDVSKITSKLYIKSTSRQSAGRFYNIWLT